MDRFFSILSYTYIGCLLFAMAFMGYNVTNNHLAFLIIACMLILNDEYEGEHNQE